MTRNTRQKLFFAPLQGATAREAGVSAADRSDLKTVVVRNGDVVLKRSDAAIFAAMNLGGGWRIVGLCRLWPRWFRDGVYRFVARYRHYIKRNACEIVSRDLRGSLLP